MADHPLALLDASCVIDLPPEVSAISDRLAVSTLTIAELAYGLHTGDPLQNAVRERRYRAVLDTFTPVPYSATAAHWYGALDATVRATGRSPRPRRFDLLLASVAADLSAVLVTRNASDFAGVHHAVTIVAV